MMIFVVYQKVLVEFLCSEFGIARLACVCLKVVRMKPLCTAGLANQFRPLRRGVIIAFRLRPVLHLIRRFTLGAPQLRLTIDAHQAGCVFSVDVVQQVLVELETAEVSEALPLATREESFYSSRGSSSGDRVPIELQLKRNNSSFLIPN